VREQVERSEKRREDGRALHSSCATIRRGASRADFE
jgi:hypothetical protein